MSFSCLYPCECRWRADHAQHRLDVEVEPGVQRLSAHQVALEHDGPGEAVGEVVIADRCNGDVDLPCVGVFEIQGGKIRVWRDYFDMNTFTSAMQS